MTQNVQLAIADTAADAEEIQTILGHAGIDSVLEAAVERDPLSTAEVPQKVLVEESQLEAALDAIEALSEPDELTAD